MRLISGLLRAAHPKQALATAAALTVAAALSGRSHALALLILFVAALLGQAIQGWHNDITDEARDRAREAPGKPIADGTVYPGTAWFLIVLCTLAVVPLSVASGRLAGACYLGAVVIGCLANRVLRSSVLSFVPWAAQFALYAWVITDGGWGGRGSGETPQPIVVALLALLGVGVHLLLSSRGLVADHEDGMRNLPLRLALKLGANRLLIVSAVFSAAVLVALLIATLDGGWHS